MSQAKSLSRLFAGLVVVGIAVILPEAGSPPAAHALTQGDARIRSVVSSQCLDVAGGSQQWGAPIIQWWCHSGSNQVFRIDDRGEIDFLRPWHTNETTCADIPGGSIANGAGLVQWGCHFASNQGFWVLSNGNGKYFIINQRSGKCLDIPGGSSQSGVQVIQWTCHAATNQQWIFEWY